VNLFLGGAGGGNRSVAHLPGEASGIHCDLQTNLGRSCFQLFPGSRRSSAGVNGGNHVVLGLGERLADGGLQQVCMSIGLLCASGAHHHDTTLHAVRTLAADMSGVM